MTGHNSIKHFRNAQIDKAKWDDCILAAPNGLIYGRSFYLDAMAPGWEALVLNDYEAVMPLTWRKKYGVRYLFQPPFMQQSGIFGCTRLSGDTIEAFLQQTKRLFRFGEIFLNYDNACRQAASPHVNFILPLGKGAAALEKQFTGDLRRNIARARKFTLQYRCSTNYETAIASFKLSYGHKIPHVGAKEYERFTNVCRSAREKNLLLVREVTDAGGILLATAIFFKDNRRLYNVMSTNLPEGRKKEANHLLFSELIKEFGGSDLLLDFEGSDLEGIAGFYKSFGAVNQPYYFFRFNRLPFLLRWLKRRSR